MTPDERREHFKHMRATLDAMADSMAAIERAAEAVRKANRAALALFNDPDLLTNEDPRI